MMGGNVYAVLSRPFLRSAHLVYDIILNLKAFEK